MSFNAPNARPAPFRSFECPFDGNDCVPWEHNRWYWWHCPGCGNRFTLNGTLCRRRP
jgi:hypothetical protein